MYLLEAFDNQITQNLKAKEAQRESTYIPSGKLSASMLGEPLQWQVLKTLGVGSKVVDDYTLRKFARGNDVEAWYLQHLAPHVVSRQTFVNYNGAIGYLDAMVDLSQTELNYERTADKSLSPHIPLEVKSVTNAKFKRIDIMRKPDAGHLLQGAFYGLATGSSHFAISYIASDDYRTLTWAFKVSDFKVEIDQIINDYNRQMQSQVVPVFVVKQAWQANPLYCKYPQWVNLTDKELKLAMDMYYPTAWEDYYAKSQKGT